MELSIKYIAHSGFSICVDSHFIMFDYSRGVLPIEDVQRHKYALVFCSHAHKDHFNKKIFHLRKYNKKIKYILSKDIDTEEDAIFLNANQSTRIDRVKINTFESTDVGVCFLIEYNGVKIFHAGDLNLWSWKEESHIDEITQATQDYYAILNTILRETTKIDIAFFPVDPRMREDYEEGAVKFLSVFKIKHFFPMHMWGNYKASHILTKKYSFKNTEIHKVSRKNNQFKIYIGD